MTPVSIRGADLVGLHRPLRDGQPSLRSGRSSTSSTTAGALVAMPSRRLAVSEDTTTELAPDCRSRVHSRARGSVEFSASAGTAQ
jgi:hypothetical protein